MSEPTKVNYDARGKVYYAVIGQSDAVVLGWEEYTRLSAAEQRAEKAEKDAQRYRFLRDYANKCSGGEWAEFSFKLTRPFTFKTSVEEYLDFAIADAALAARSPEDAGPATRATGRMTPLLTDEQVRERYGSKP